MTLSGTNCIQKINKLCALCAMEHSDIVCVTETWLGKYISKSKYSAPEFSCFSCDGTDKVVGLHLMYPTN